MMAITMAITAQDPGLEDPSTIAAPIWGPTGNGTLT